MTRARLAWLDMLRGIALLAMIAYHLVWDLGFYGLIDPFIPERAGFKLFGHGIATTFLLLAGVSLVLAFRAIDPWLGFGRRLAVLLAAAVGVSLASLWFSPSSPIFFGILHCIALASLIALPLLATPLPVLAGIIALVLCLPLLVASPVLDRAGLSWLGLGTAYPISEDFRPLLPWAGMLFLGILAGRIAPMLKWPNISIARLSWLAWLGRHSLLIYLLHQPILLGTVSVIASYAQPPMPSFAQDFDNQCRIECMAAGGKAPVCTGACGCIADRLKADELWSVVQGGRLTGAQQARLEALAVACRGKAE